MKFLSVIFCSVLLGACGGNVRVTGVNIPPSIVMSVAEGIDAISNYLPEKLNNKPGTSFDHSIEIYIEKEGDSSVYIKRQYRPSM